MRKFIIGGNWKMNLAGNEAIELAKGIVSETGDLKSVDVVMCPPFTSLQIVREAIKGSNIFLGAQNMFWEESGAYTGEISPSMLLTENCKFVILGHSERRTYFGETDEKINRKFRAAQNAGLIPIVCIGETESERKEGITEKVLTAQFRGCFKEIPAAQMVSVVIAYEPVWAIGTGLTATPEQAQEIHEFIRGLLEKEYGADAAHKIRIQYGGSMKPDNCHELLEKPDVDGGLIGGASLKVEAFAAIVKTAADLS